MVLFPNQIATGESARHPQQRGGASHGPPAPPGPGRHQHGDHGCGQRPAADHRGQLTETMIGTAVQPRRRPVFPVFREAKKGRFTNFVVKKENNLIVLASTQTRW